MSETKSRPEQVFFADPAIDRMMGVVMALAGEVYVLRDRVRCMEALLVRQGALAEGALDVFSPTAEQAEAAAADRDAVALAQPLLRDGRRSDPHRGFARRLPTAAAVVADAVLLPVGEVGVSGPELVLDVSVVLRALVFVAHQEADGGAAQPGLPRSPPLVPVHPAEVELGV